MQKQTTLEKKKKKKTSIDIEKCEPNGSQWIQALPETKHPIVMLPQVRLDLYTESIQVF